MNNVINYVSCPECSDVAWEEDIDCDSGILTCRKCKHQHDYAEEMKRVNMAFPEGFDINATPKKVTVSLSDKSYVACADISGKKSILMCLVFSLIFTVGFVSHLQEVGSLFSEGTAGALGVSLGAGLGLFSWGLTFLAVMGRVVVRFDSAEGLFTVLVGAVGIGWKKSFHADEIAEIVWTETMEKDGKSTIERICIKRNAKGDIVFGRFLSDLQREYLIYSIRMLTTAYKTR